MIPILLTEVNTISGRKNNKLEDGSYYDTFLLLFFGC